LSSELTGDQRTLAFQFADVALPEYAADCEPWELNDGVWTRLFTVREWELGAVSIAVSGEQSHLGDVTCWLYVGGEEQFAGLDLRLLMATLVEAGTLLDDIA
jgi:hypothetical protein